MGHYYHQSEDGTVTPRHFVEVKSRPGDLRPTTIRDVRQWWDKGEAVVPSVTTVLNVLDKGALTNWKIDQHLDRALEAAPNWSEFTPEGWRSEVKRLTELEMDKAPSAGTDLHDKLENYVLGRTDELTPHDFQLCANVLGVVCEETGVELRNWIPEQAFVSEEGFGGRVDLHHPASPTWVIDFKSKREAAKFKPGKMVFNDHRMQAAAYRAGLWLDGGDPGLAAEMGENPTPPARCANVFVCLETGQIDFHEHSQVDLAHGWELFQHALAIWQLQNHAPTHQTETA